MQASLLAYSPETELIVHQGTEGNFGDAYNAAMRKAFETHDEIIIANDDIVLRPESMQVFLEDVEALKKSYGRRLGFVATLSDVIRPGQNIRYNNGQVVQRTHVISPIFSYISKEAFNDVQFPPLNWYSDDVMCEDLRLLGYEHFISRAYVTHAGSTSIGHDVTNLVNDARPWLLKHRPLYAAKWGIK
jgi:hypothetical protein